MSDLSLERWRPVPGYEGYYEVSDHGRVRSVDRLIRRPSERVDRRIPGKVLTLRKPTGQHGYVQAVLSREGKVRFVAVHRLLLLAFVGPCPDGMEACHGNDIPDDNRLANLRWDTHASNMDDRAAREASIGRRSRCKRGHEFTPENTYQRPNGRECKACRAVHMDNFRTRKAVAA
jgi:hypothetical protein